MRNPGMMFKLPDNRLVIVYNKTCGKIPGKMILNLVDEKYQPLLKEDGKPRLLIKSNDDYVKLIQSSILIGYVD